MSNLDEISQAIGALQASQTAMEAQLHSVQKDLSGVKVTLSEARGGWKTLLMVGGAAGAFGAVIGKVIPWWPR